ncbi:Thiol peroxidase [Campylobacter majalis]|uniref:Thiol peroxidase n=1 Tax=Campylobacter majalis TaxID=2790656 RepID=A0ABN7KCI8_9BACT|nr:thiol peroxidase [Campylobacter majalis]CAD7289777.1 Thiol peroxidase [Campylobacter majalis]
MTKRTGEVTFQGGPLTILGDKIKVGDKAPDFTILANDLSPIKLSDYAGKVVVIAVFPSVDTPVCAMQLAKFNHEASSFSKDVQLLSVSVDLPFAIGRFCADKGIENAKTGSDHKDLDFGLKYGFVIEELRLLARGTIIVDKDGKIAYAEYVSEVTSEPDYAKALDVVKSLA